MFERIRISNPRLWFLWVLIFVVGSFFLFSPPLITELGHDHGSLLSLRQFSSGEVDYFLKAASFNRTHVIRSEDIKLFRPLVGGILSLFDILFRHDLKWLGIFSIVLHGGCSFALFLFLKKSLGLFLGFFLTLLFFVQYSGTEMILWRHISPYMVSVLFFLIGLLGFKKKIKFLISSCFFVSMLFHEILFVALPLSGLIVYLVSFKKGRKIELGKVYFLVPLLYLFTNVAHYLFFLKKDFIETASKAGPGLVHAIKVFIHVCGMSFLSWVCPWLVDFSKGESLFDTRMKWGFSPLLGAPSFFCGLFVIFLLFLFLKKNGKRDDSLDLDSFEKNILILSYAVAVFSGIAFGRVYRSGFSYLMHSSYYFYFTNLCFLLLSSAFFREKSSKWFVNVGIILFVTPQILIGAIKIKGRIALDKDALNLYQSRIHEWAKMYERDTDKCLGGALNVKDIDPSFVMLLSRYSCRLRRGEPQYLMADDYNQSRWRSITTQFVTVSPSIYLQPEADTIHEKLPKARIQVINTDLSPTLLMIELSTPVFSGLVFGYKDKNHYLSVFHYKGQLYLLDKSNEVTKIRSFPTRFKEKNQLSFSVLDLGEDFFILLNDTVIDRGIKNKGNWGGTIGVLSSLDVTDEIAPMLSYVLDSPFQDR